MSALHEQAGPASGYFFSSQLNSLQVQSSLATEINDAKYNDANDTNSLSGHDRLVAVY